MQEPAFDLPEDVNHEVSEPKAAEAEQVATPSNATALEEINQKLDAILAALSVGEE